MRHGTRQRVSWEWLAGQIVAQLVAGRKSAKGFTDMLNQNCPVQPDQPPQPKDRRRRKYGRLS